MIKSQSAPYSLPCEALTALLCAVSSLPLPVSLRIYEGDARVKPASDTFALPGYTPSASVVTFREASEEWLRLQKPHIKDSTYMRYYNILHSYLFPAFAETPITQITRQDFLEFAIGLKTNGGEKKQGLSASMVSSIASVAKNIFLFAAREKGIPAADISGLPLKEEQKEPQVLNRRDQKILQDYLLNHLIPSNLGILLCLYTGLRIGEICAMKWEDISEDEKTVFVHKSMDRAQIPGEGRTKIVITAPKSACSIRKIPVNGKIAVLLSEHRRDDNAFILTGDAERFIEPRSLRRIFKKVLADCGIAPVNFHALRHTFATRCVEVGFEVKTLSKILGHATVNITLNRYVHPSMEQKRKNMALLENILD